MYMSFVILYQPCHFNPVQLNNIWVTGIVGNPMYVACKHCRTKIDVETGHCKRHHTHSCQTERDDEIAVLATVNLADDTGETVG